MSNDDIHRFTKQFGFIDSKQLKDLRIVQLYLVLVFTNPFLQAKPIPFPVPFATKFVLIFN